MDLRRAASTFMASIITLLVPAGLVAVASAATPGALRGARSGLTAKSALDTERALNQALLTSNADALEGLLARSWIVVSGFGGIAERDNFIAYIREGGSTRKTMILSEPRVRVYGKTALVTTRLSTSGRSLEEVHGKIVSHCFDVKERQTDALVLETGGWKSVLLHETVIPGTLRVTVFPGRKDNCP